MSDAVKTRTMMKWSMPDMRLLAATGWAVAVILVLFPTIALSLRILAGQPGAQVLNDFHIAQRQRALMTQAWYTEPAETTYLLGDSILAGISPASLAPEGRVFNLGISGDLAADMTTRLTQYPFLHEAKCLLVQGGINDMIRGRSPDDVEAAWQAWLAGTPAGVPIVASAILPVDEPRFAARNRVDNAEIFIANQRIEQVCRAHQTCLFVPVPKTMKNAHGDIRPAYVMADGVHLTVAGYQAWKPALAEALADAGCL